MSDAKRCRCGLVIPPTEVRCPSCSPIHINDGNGLALCKHADGSMVTGALHSDCVECRQAQMVGPVTQVGCEWRPEPEWAREPSWTDEEEMTNGTGYGRPINVDTDEAQRKREGL